MSNVVTAGFSESTCRPLVVKCDWTQFCQEELGQNPGGYTSACVCWMMCVCEKRPNLRGGGGSRIPEDSRGIGSAPSSTVLLRWWMERSVWRMPSAVALAKAAAREHGQLLQGGGTDTVMNGSGSQKSSVNVNRLLRHTDSIVWSCRANERQQQGYFYG